MGRGALKVKALPALGLGAETTQLLAARIQRHTHTGISRHKHPSSLHECIHPHTYTSHTQCGHVHTALQDTGAHATPPRCRSNCPPPGPQWSSGRIWAELWVCLPPGAVFVSGRAGCVCLMKEYV